MKDEGVQSIKELGKQLKRLHKLLNMPNVDEHIGTIGIGRIVSEIEKLDACLMEIARRHNGLEY